VAVTISLALILGIAVFVLYRTGYIRPLPGLTVALFGFTLASTGLGPGIQHLLDGLVHWASNVSA